MKRILTIMAISLVAIASQAVVIFQDDFSSGATSTSTAFGSRVGDGDGATGSLGNWFSGPDGIVSGALKIKGQTSGANNSTAPRAGVIVLDGSSLGAGDLTLSWDFSMFNNVHMDVQIWDVQQTSGDSGSYYTAKYADNGVLSNQVTTAGDAASSFLGGLTINNTSGGALAGSTNVTVTYDGTGDIALMFGTAPNVNFYQPTTTFDNVLLEKENTAPVWDAATNTMPTAYINGLDYINNSPNSLTNFVTDGEGNALIFTNLTAMPDGLTLAANGLISGTAIGPAGDELVTVGVYDDQGSATNTAVVLIPVVEPAYTWGSSWSEDFSAASITTFNGAASQSVEVTNEVSWMEWAGRDRASISSGELRIFDTAFPGGAVAFGAGIALNTSTVSLPTEVTRLTLSYDYRQLSNGGQAGRFGVQVSEANIGSGGAANHYDQDFTNFGDRDNGLQAITATGDASVNEVLPYEINFFQIAGATGSTVRTFIYSGTGDDLVIQLSMGKPNDNADFEVLYDNLELTGNRAPVWAADTNVLADAAKDESYSADLKDVCSDPEGDTIVFANTSAMPAGLTLASDGTISGTVTAALGTYLVDVEASDTLGSATTAATLEIEVVNAAPVWGVDPFDKGYVAVGQSLSDTLTDRTFDANGDSLTYTEIGSGPAWLTITSGGAISGTPSAGDKGLNSWTVEVSDGSLASTATFSILVIDGTLVYEENFNTAVTLYGGFNSANEDGNRYTATVDLEMTPTAWAHTFSDSSDNFNLFDGNDPGDVGAGISGALEFSQSGGATPGRDTEGVGVAIDASVFGGTAGWYEATVSHVTNNGYGVISKLGMEVWEAEEGVALTNDYYLNLRGFNIYAGDPTGQLKIDKPAASDATFAELASQDLGTTLGQRNVPFYYDGTGDVCLLLACSADGRARSAIDNVRVFRVADAVDSYSTWNALYGGTLLDYGLDVDNSGTVETDELPIFDGLTYIYNERQYPSTVNYALLTTTNLVDGIWSNLYSTVIGTSTPLPGDAWVTVTNSVIYTNQLFLQLEVTE